VQDTTPHGLCSFFMANINKTPKPQLDEEELALEINEQFRTAKLYLDPHNARVFDPRVFRIIETITPRMVASEPTGTFYPVENGDVVTSQILNALMKYDWRRAEMFPKLVTFVKSMLIFGTAFGRTYWDYRTCEKERMEPKKMNGRLVWIPRP
jgi:hypothetical protein